jgi:hypothetical protein
MCIDIQVANNGIGHSRIAERYSRVSSPDLVRKITGADLVRKITGTDLMRTGDASTIHVAVWYSLHCCEMSIALFRLSN